MPATRELILQLKDCLSACGFGGFHRGPLGRAEGGIACWAPQPARPKRKTLCAVVPAPPSIADADAAARFVRDLRRTLTRAHPGLPWPKRLATYTVLLADEDLCRNLGGRCDGLIDDGSLHVNVLLGAIVVDLAGFRYLSDTTWGLIDTGDTFARLRATVEQWCQTHRRPVRLAPRPRRRQAVGAV